MYRRLSKGLMLVLGVFPLSVTGCGDGNSPSTVTIATGAAPLELTAFASMGGRAFRVSFMSTPAQQRFRIELVRHGSKFEVRVISVSRVHDDILLGVDRCLRGRLPAGVSQSDLAVVVKPRPGLSEAQAAAYLRRQPASQCIPTPVES